MDDSQIKLLKDSIKDISDALSGIDMIKDGLGLRGNSKIDDSLETAKSRLRRILLIEFGEL